jgi:prevent-host-death family protein
MVAVGTYEAKSTLTKLIERVAAGETIIITRHGKPVAKLAPVLDIRPKPDPAMLAAAFDRLQAEQPAPTGTPLWTLKDEGRR